VEPPHVEQAGLAIWFLRAQVRDPADHQPTGHPLVLATGSESSETDLGDLGPGDPRLGLFVEDRIGVLDRRPPVVADAGDRGFHAPGAVY